MSDRTLGAEMAKMATRLEAMQPDRALWAARCDVVRVVSRLAAAKGYSYKKACKLFVEHTLPEVAVAPELADLNRILRVAGFGGGESARVTERTLRDWKRESEVPAVADIDMSSEFHTAEEYAAMARAGLLSGMPMTVDGMRKYLESAVAASARPDRLKRRFA